MNKEETSKRDNLSEKYETLAQCPYCGSVKIDALFEAPDRLTEKGGTFYLSKCSACELVLQNPRIKEKFIGEFYTNELGYYQPVSSQANKLTRRTKEVLVNHFGYVDLGTKSALKKIATLPFKRREKIKITPQYKRGGSLLEIGCSHGDRLAYFKELGWKVSGIEQDKRSVAHAKRKRKLDVVFGAIEDFQVEDKSFDVIIMSMVLEHLAEPFLQLEKIVKWLKPGGELIFSIPYFDGVEFSLFKKYAYGLQLPTHYTFLNKKIIKEFFLQRGFSSSHFFFHYFDRDFYASLDYFVESSPNMLGRLVQRISLGKKTRKFVVKPVLVLLSFLGKTSRVTVVVNKERESP